MRKQGIDSKIALEVIIKKAFKNIKQKYGASLDDNVFIGFLVNEIKEYMVLNIKVRCYKEVEKMVGDATASTAS